MTTQQPTHRSLQLEINELRAHRNELMGRRTPTEEVQEFNSTLDEVRDALQGTASDINEAREQVAEYSGHLRAFSQRAGEAMDTPEIREFVQGVNEGLGQTSARIGDVDEVLGRIDSVVGLLETLLDAADAPGDDQIMELADQFGAMVELLSPLIDRIPVLGQFFTLYAMMIRRIAGSLGVIQEIMAERTRIWQMLWPDEVAYNDGGTWESRLENEIRDVQKEIDDRVAQQLELALAGEVPLGSGRVAADYVLSSAMSDCATEYNAYNSGRESAARGETMTARNEARARMESARVDLQIVADQLTEDEVRLSTTPRSQRGPRLAGEARVDAGERAVAAARARLREREAEYDEAQQAFETADAAYDAQRQIWLDCLKTHIVATIPYANTRAGSPRATTRC